MASESERMAAYVAHDHNVAWNGLWDRCEQAEADNERLKSLAKDVGGCWRVFEAGLREVIGHTNYNVIARKLADAGETGNEQSAEKAK